MESIHKGELFVQTLLGVRQPGDPIGAYIPSTIPEYFNQFIEAQNMVVVGAKDSEQNVYCYLLAGEPGFMGVLEPDTLRIDAGSYATDLYAPSFQSGKELGLLIINMAMKARIRINGAIVKGMADGEVLVKVAQAYSNCNRFIHGRSLSLRKSGKDERHVAYREPLLNSFHQNIIANSDTFFIATSSRDGKMDASHRGGNRGFVQVMDDRTLLFPDYSGNMMFNTLGNLVENSSIGLLFIDFDNGDTLHITGDAEILWDRNEGTDPQFPGAQRLLKIAIREVMQMQTNDNFIWRTS